MCIYRIYKLLRVHQMNYLGLYKYSTKKCQVHSYISSVAQTKLLVVSPRSRSLWNYSPCLQFQSFYHCKSGVYGYKPEAIPSDCQDNFIGAPDLIMARNENSNLFRFITAYREYGHFKANVNPLTSKVRNVPELNSSLYGLQNSDYLIKGLLFGNNSSSTLSLPEIETRLRNLYCGEISAEFMHLESMEEREWFAQEFENLQNFTLSTEDKVLLAFDLLKSQAWDNFVGTKLHTVKRYGGEGAESILGFIRQSLKSFANDNVEEVLVGMAHRGRINILGGLLQFPLPIILGKMKGLSEFPSNVEYATGDVLSHLHTSVHLELGDSKSINVAMLPCSSHLESVNPVTCGMARGRQRRLEEGHYNTKSDSLCGDKVAAIVIHGDAAVGGQGINQETLTFSQLPNFSIGGTVHMVTNNQVGFTTPGERTRSCFYSTDLCKMCSAPAIHVNGDNPEAVVKATDLSVRYQRKFRKDVFLDIVCWRRWGHNELDDPRFTNPLMYHVIDNRRSVPDLYADKLIEENVLSEVEKNNIVSEYYKQMNEALKEIETFVPNWKLYHLQKHWSSMKSAPNEIEIWDTGVCVNLLKFLGRKSVLVPDSFDLNKHLRKVHIEARCKRLESGLGIDWATAEALAMGSLLHQGYDVRLCGQDVGRGTFSQRHCMLVDQSTAEIYIPLNHMEENQKGFLEVANSILSEEAVLGFEYGMSIESPDILCIWEAQFGDFFNGAQIILDTYVSSGEIKWLLQSGLVIVLPHGYDGAGPEHTSCRLERFLQMCDSKENQPDSERVNWNIINPTTSAQIFHALRRQIVRDYRKPLIVAGPKALLRLPAAASKLEEFAPGSYFQSVIGDQSVIANQVKKVIFVSGKHYYSLMSERKKLQITDTAIVRLESLCPFPTHQINEELSKYKKVTQFIWAQEEHRNMGPWSFVNPRFRNLCGTQLQYAGRDVLGTPAVSIKALHEAEVNSILEQAFS